MADCEPRSRIDAESECALVSCVFRAGLEPATALPGGRSHRILMFERAPAACRLAPDPRPDRRFAARPLPSGSGRLGTPSRRPGAPSLAPCIWANPSPASGGRSGRAPGGGGDRDRDHSLAPRRARLPVSPGGSDWWYCAGIRPWSGGDLALPVGLMDLKPGQRALDMCAAPGGKTAQIAFALGNRGTLVGERYLRCRIKALQGNLDRLGIVERTDDLLGCGQLASGRGRFDRIGGCPLFQRGDNPAQSLHARAAGPRSPARLAPDSGRCCAAVSGSRPEGESSIPPAPRPRGKRAGGGGCPAKGVSGPDPAGAGRGTWNCVLAGSDRVGRPAAPDQLALCIRIWPTRTTAAASHRGVLEKDPAADGEGPLPTGPELRPGIRLTGTSGCGPLRQVRVAADAWPDVSRPSPDPPGPAPDGPADHRPPPWPKSEGSRLFFHLPMCATRTTTAVPCSWVTGPPLCLDLTQTNGTVICAGRPSSPTPAQLAAHPLGRSWRATGDMSWGSRCCIDPAWWRASFRQVEWVYVWGESAS